VPAVITARLSILIGSAPLNIEVELQLQAATGRG
jgi:hypothetical protein